MIISDTGIKRWRLCRRKYFWRKRMPPTLGLMQAQGLILHEALGAKYHPTGALGKPVDALNAEYARLMADNPTLYAAPEEFEAMRDHSLKLLELYDKHYINETWTPLQVESEFLVSLGEACYNTSCQQPYPPDLAMPPITDDMADTFCPECGAEIHYLLGRIDLIESDNGSIEVVDHKVTSGGTWAWLEAFANSYQLMGYVYAVERSTRQRPRGFVVNVIKSLKTLDQRGSPFLRKLFFTGQLDLNEMVANRLAYAKEISAAGKVSLSVAGAQTYRKNDQACNWGGTCPMSALCWDSPAIVWYDPPEWMLPDRRGKLDLVADEIIGKE